MTDHTNAAISGRSDGQGETPLSSADPLARPSVGDRVHDPETGLVGTVLDWWSDDGGYWLEVRYDEVGGRLGEDLMPGEGPA